VLIETAMITMFVFTFFAGFSNLQKKALTKAQVAQPHNQQMSLSVAFRFRIFLIIGAGYAFWLIACFPANMSPDSLISYEQALAGLYTDHHPAIYAFLIRACIIYVKSPFMPVLVQTIVQAAIWANAFTFIFVRWGAGKKILYIAAFLIGFSPVNGVMTATLWKDVAFSIAILALTVSLARITQTSRMQFAQGALLIVALILSALLRHNGIAPVITTCIVLSVVILKKRARIVPVIALIAIICIKWGGVYPLMSVAPTDYRLKLASPFHAVGSVFYRGGYMDAESERLLTETVPKEKYVTDYNPFSINTYMTPEVLPPVISALDSIDTKTMLGIYIKTFLKNPITMIRHHLSASDIQWCVFQSADPWAYNWRYIVGIGENHLGLHKSYNLSVYNIR
jgi:hypothetical protein